LSADEIAEFTKADEYWNLVDPDAQELAEELGSPERIYDYLVDNFIYDYGRLNGDIKRLGSEYALDNPSNVICMEFTDSFITLVRILGIPAREHNGFAYTENSKLRPLSLSEDVLHAWPEYFDKETKQWVQVDPTWGNSTGGVDYFHKFDLDHFTFVVHGADNSYPVPAGSYKTDVVKGKDIEVGFADSFDPVEAVEVNIEGFDSGLSGVPVMGEVEVVNVGSVALYNFDVSLLVSKSGQELGSEMRRIDVLPPFAAVVVPVRFVTHWSDDGGEYRLEVGLMDESVERVFELKPVVRVDYLAWGVGGFVGGGMWMVVVVGFLNWRRRRFVREREEDDEMFGKIEVF
jgi:hypothetical protein